MRFWKFLLTKINYIKFETIIYEIIHNYIRILSFLRIIFYVFFVTIIYKKIILFEEIVDD